MIYDAMPRSFREMLARAAHELGGDEANNLVAHYTQVMPAMRERQRREALFEQPLEWSRLPRLSTIFDRLTALCRAAGVAYEPVRAPTIGALYERTYYGGFMPLLYGYPADLAYFTRRGRELGLDAHGTIDRYLAAPILHELCHFGRDRDALLPLHLDECIAGYIGAHVWPELVFPQGDHDDAIYAAPWLSQVGQAVVRAFGIHNVVRAQAGAVPWNVALPAAFVDEATRFGWSDWRKRRTQHFLSDTLDPDPWVTLALAHGVPDDPQFDRAIVRDALHAMCLASECVEGSFRTRTKFPSAPIKIEPGRVSTATARYWLPPAIRAERVVALESLAELDALVDELTTS